MDENRKNELISHMRTKILKKGCGALKQLGCVFRKMDIDFSKKICFEELQQGMRIYGIDVSEDELKLLFDAFDKDQNQLIDFHEFMIALRPPMPKSRVRVIDEAFDKLDVDHDGVLNVEDLKGSV
nr:hypothetical protein BaRGS_026881 [Batillaria attramentaria]